MRTQDLDVTKTPAEALVFQPGKSAGHQPAPQAAMEV